MQGSRDGSWFANGRSGNVNGGYLPQSTPQLPNFNLHQQQPFGYNLHNPYFPNFPPHQFDAGSNGVSRIHGPSSNPRRDAQVMRIDKSVNETRKSLAAAGQNVSSTRVSQLVLAKHQADSFGVQMHDVPSFSKLMALESKINAFIHCFIGARGMVSLHDLEAAICGNESVNCFDALELGPLLQHPLVLLYYPSNMHQQQQQQQLQQFGLHNHINNQLLQFAVANNNLMNHPLPLAQPGFFRPHLDPSTFTCQPQLNSSFSPLPYPPVPSQHHNQHLRPPAFSLPPPQGHSIGNVNNANGFGSKGNDFQNKFKGSGQGFQRSQLHQAHDSNKKLGFNKDHRGKGKMASGLDAGKVAKKKKRSITWLYTPKEITQWREARRKNFPTKLNVEKKVVSESNLDEEAKMRREQLVEILAKQDELGVEVAEIESLNGKPFRYKDGKRGRLQNGRHDRRRQGEKDKFNKKPRFQDQNSCQESSVMTRKPTLLEKLLSKDIKRDKSRLLQVFRFMVTNKFFNELPEQPLKLPLVILEQTGCEHAREDEDPTADVLSDDDDDVDINGDEAVER